MKLGTNIYDYRGTVVNFVLELPATIYAKFLAFGDEVAKMLLNQAFFGAPIPLDIRQLATP
jgi:hypothetical protein